MSTYRTSTIPLVKAALVTMLTTGEHVERQIDVHYGRPRDPSREQIIIGDTASSSQEWALLGNRQRQEDYEIELQVRVMRPGDSQQEATERAFEIFAGVELELRTYPTLNVPGVISVQIATPSLIEGVWDDQGFAALVDCALRISARI